MNRARIEQAVQRSRRLLARSALLAGAASMIPLPGLDLLVDLSVISKMFTDINREFALTPEQIAQLTPQRQKRVYRAVMALGGAMIGRAVTREAVIGILRRAGIRVSAKRIVRWVPWIGATAGAALSYGALHYIGERHIGNCRRVAETLVAGKNAASD